MPRIESREDSKTLTVAEIAKNSKGIYYGLLGVRNLLPVALFLMMILLKPTNVSCYKDEAYKKIYCEVDDSDLVYTKHKTEESVKSFDPFPHVLIQESVFSPKISSCLLYHLKRILKAHQKSKKVK